MNYKLTKYEKETIILFSEADTYADVQTYDKRLIRNLLSHCERFPEQFRIKEDIGDGGYNFIVPKKYVKINAPREMSEEQRQKKTKQLEEARRRKQEYNE